MVYTYPVKPADLGAASPGDLQAFLASPQLIARRMTELLDESKFISFYLLASPPKFTVALRERFRDEWEELQAMNQSAPKKKKPFNGTTKDIFKDLE